MNATELQDALYNAFESIAEARNEIKGDYDDLCLTDFIRDMVDDLECVTSVHTCKSQQMLTTDAGLVVRTADGAEFQITIVQSRRGRAE